MPPCPAICAGAAAISASMRPCVRPRRERDMTYHSAHPSFAIANVSRRKVLEGLVAGGGLVLAAQIPGMRPAIAAYATGAAAMPNGVVTDPHVFVSIDPSGVVSIVAHRAEMGTGAARTT